MDTVTQMLFGATVAQAGFRAKLGPKALLAGAVLGLVPDLDVAVGWIGGPFASWQHHRGLTHSLPFGPLVGPVIGWGLWRWHRRSRQPGALPPDALRAWQWLAMLVLFTHPLIDLFTSYGTQLLWPLTDTRFAINALPIIDPVYSAVLMLALVAGSLRRRPRLAQDIAAAALLFIGLYSLGGWAFNAHIERVAREDFGRAADVSAYPLLFQPYYRRVVALTPEAAHVGYYSVLNPRTIAWQALPTAGGPEVDAVRTAPEGRLLQWFAMDKVLWTARPDGMGTVIEGTDLRYGMPGSTNRGAWGIRARVGTDQRVADPVEMIVMPREVSHDTFSRFWSDMTGR
jgi:inner membrane protein